MNKNKKKSRGELVVTKSGFRCYIKRENMDDMRVLDLIAESQNGENPLVVSELLTRLLGLEQKGRLYKHLETNGRVPIHRTLAEIEEIFLALGEQGKNS